jgi:multifunctional beta-oxidation protein
VWPGETLVTEMWRIDDGVVFQVRVAERDDVVVKEAWAKLI